TIDGRSLDHTRIYVFGGGQEDPAKGDGFISSADWMYRNLSARVETAVPVHDAAARARLCRIVDVMLADHRSAWDLRSDGSYTQRMPDPSMPPDSPHAAGTFSTRIAAAVCGI